MFAHKVSQVFLNPEPPFKKKPTVDRSPLKKKKTQPGFWIPEPVPESRAAACVGALRFGLEDGSPGSVLEEYIFAYLSGIRGN